MKGTLFSADFILDSEDNPRLLEINTDTNLVKSAIDNHLDWSSFGTVLSGSVFDTLHLIYKPLHKHLVKDLVSYVNSNVSNITSITHQEEENCAVYLGSNTDTSNKFILRLAYDETAVLDSTYAKSEVNLYSLFNTYNELESIPPAYHSSSANGIINTITSSFNAHNLPDFVVKTESTNGTTNLSIGLKKLGLPDTGSDYRFNTFIDGIKADDVVVTNFIPNLSGSYCTSIRSVQIVYGTNLDLCFLGEHQAKAIFEIPTTVVTGSGLDNDVDRKHKFEFTTNFPKGNHGVWSRSSLISSSGDPENVFTPNTGSGYSYKSYFVSGSPDTDNVTELNDWYHSGSSFPSGSYLTSSNIENRDSYENPNKDLYAIELENGDNFTLGGLTLLPTLDTASNVITWKETNNVKVGNKVFTDDNVPLLIVSNSLQISDTDGLYDTAHNNMESVDTYLVQGTGSNLLVHNPFGAGRFSFYEGCFIAGTLISLPNGETKAIESIVEGDEILTYNNETEEQETGIVGWTEEREVDTTIVLTLLNPENEENPISTITTTAEHPFFANKSGYKKAYDLALSDLLLNSNDDNVEIISIEAIPEPTTVYNLRDVSDNHNFYADTILVHNK